MLPAGLGSPFGFSPLPRPFVGRSLHQHGDYASDEGSEAGSGAGPEGHNLFHLAGIRGESPPVPVGVVGVVAHPDDKTCDPPDDRACNKPDEESKL